MTCGMSDGRVLSDRERRIRELVESLPDDFDERVEALVNDPSYRPGPRKWRDDPDPLGMDWKWLLPGSRTRDNT